MSATIQFTAPNEEAMRRQVLEYLIAHNPQKLIEDVVTATTLSKADIPKYIAKIVAPWLPQNTELVILSNGTFALRGTSGRQFP